MCAVCGVGAAEDDWICSTEAAGLNFRATLAVTSVSLLRPELAAAAQVSKAGEGEALARGCCRLLMTAAGSIPEKVNLAPSVLHHMIRSSMFASSFIGF